MATTSIWDKLKNIIMPSTTGPTQVADPMVAMWQGMQQVEQARQQGQNQGALERIRAIGELQAQDQARKDLGNQALQNQFASRPGAAWGPNGILRSEQLANPQLNGIPEWAKPSSLLTPEGMKNAVGVSQVQNPFQPPQQANANYAPIMENGAQVGNGVWNNAGSMVGFSDVGTQQASPQMQQSMQQAQQPWANWTNLIGQSNQDLANPMFKNIFASLLQRR